MWQTLSLITSLHHRDFPFEQLLKRLRGGCFSFIPSDLLFKVCKADTTLINTSNHWIGLDYLTVPMKSTGSWGMMASLLRRSSRPIWAILIPSMITEPLVSSTSLNRATPREDFPANRKDAAWRIVCTCWKGDLKRSWKRCRLGNTKGHLYLILCGPQCRWSPQAGWWRTDS